MKHGKKFQKMLESVDRTKEYSLEDAIGLVKTNATRKFDESIDVAINLGVDPKQPEQNIRLTVALPYGTGKSVRVLVVTKGQKAKEALEAGADFVGDDDFIKKLSDGWSEIDTIITTPDMMPQLGRLGKVLGPKGLMPNPKSGTVTTDIEKAVKEIKAGRIEIRVDKGGIVHSAVGKCSFDAVKIKENILTILTRILKAKPANVKGVYLKKITLSSSMGPGIKISKAVAG